MSPERLAAAVDRWVRLYTIGLPPPIVERRLAELRADVHDQIAHERSLGTSDRHLARRIASRMVRGAAADLSWRRHQACITRPSTPTTREHRTVNTPSVTTSAARVGAFVAVGLSIPALAMATSDEADWGVFDFVMAGVLLGIVGVCASMAARRAGSLVIAAAVAVAGTLAAVAGQLDDAPGLIVLGLLMLAGAAAMAQRRLSRSR